MRGAMILGGVLGGDRRGDRRFNKFSSLARRG
jgi:hypothetical protein